VNDLSAEVIKSIQKDRTKVGPTPKQVKKTKKRILKEGDA
jgi:hypothetical protein